MYRYKCIDCKNMDKIDIEKHGQNEHFSRGVCFPNIGIFSNIGIAGVVRSVVCVLFAVDYKTIRL